MANNKVVLGSVTIIDISDTTAVAEDVAQGKEFYGADGNKVVGTASGGITPTGTLAISQNGTYDVTNYANADVNVSGGGGMTETLLWENPDRTSSFPFQNINFNHNLFDTYEYIKIVYATSTQGEPYYDITINGRTKYQDNTPRSALWLTLCFNSTNKRTMKFINQDTQQTQVQFWNCTIYDGTRTTNDRCIPVAIYGLK